MTGRFDNRIAEAVCVSAAAPLAREGGVAPAIHPHMLRHGCGCALANAGHDTRALQAWLGHKNIQHTVRYTELAHLRTSGDNRRSLQHVEGPPTDR